MRKDIEGWSAFSDLRPAGDNDGWMVFWVFSAIIALSQIGDAIGWLLFGSWGL